MINSKNGFGEFELTALKISPVTEVPDRELFCRLEKKVTRELSQKCQTENRYIDHEKQKFI